MVAGQLVMCDFGGMILVLYCRMQEIDNWMSVLFNVKIIIFESQYF